MQSVAIFKAGASSSAIQDATSCPRATIAKIAKRAAYVASSIGYHQATSGIIR